MPHPAPPPAAPADAIGIDIGGTNVKAARVGGDGRVLRRLDAPTVDDADRLVSLVRDLIERLGGEAAPVGIASPGLAGGDNRAIRWMRGRLEAVEGLVWADRLGRPAAVLNDAHAATVGEAWVGAAAGLRHVVLLTLGTGVGGGVICDGRLLQGRLGRAGHLGHITLDLAGPPDIVHTPGSLEDLVGDHTVRARTGFASTADLVAAARAGDGEAAGHWDRTVQALACGVVSLVNAFDPEAVVIGGGIAKAGEALFGPLREKLAAYEWRPTGEAVRIIAAELGDLAGAVGAARFATTLATEKESHP